VGCPVLHAYIIDGLIESETDQDLPFLLGRSVDLLSFFAYGRGGIGFFWSVTEMGIHKHVSPTVLGPEADSDGQSTSIVVVVVDVSCRRTFLLLGHWDDLLFFLLGVLFVTYSPMKYSIIM